MVSSSDGGKCTLLIMQKNIIVYIIIVIARIHAFIADISKIDTKIDANKKISFYERITIFNPHISNFYILFIHNYFSISIIFFNLY